MPTYLSDEDVFGPQGQQQQQAQPKYLSDVDVGLEQPQSMPADIAKSAGVGIGRGLIGLAGLPSDITELGARGINAAVQSVGRLTGLDVGPSREPQQPTFGSGSIQQGVEQVTGPFYKPQTLPGKYAEQIGEFAPAIIGGPESLATRALTRAVVPGMVAETAGQVADKVAPEYAPYARTVAGIAAGLRPTSFTKYAVPNVAEIEAAGSNLYKHPDVAAVRINPNAYHRELAAIKSDLENTVDPDLMTGTWKKLTKEESASAPAQVGAMARLTGVRPKSKPDVSLDDLDTFRKQLSMTARDYSQGTRAEDRMAATIALKRLDDFPTTLKPGDLTAGDINKALPKLQEARDNWSAARRVETADKKIASALLRAGSTYSGHNLENAIRQNLRRIIDPDANPRLRMGWTPLEMQRAKDIVDGSHISNALREVGNRLSGIHGLGGGLVFAGERLMQGHPGNALLWMTGAPAAGLALRGLGNLRTYRQAQGLTDLLASRAPLAQQWRAQGRMAPTGPVPFLSGLGAYSAPAVNYTAQGYPYIQGRVKGGRVTKSFRCRVK